MKMKRALVFLLLLFTFLLPVSGCFKESEGPEVDRAVLRELHYRGLKFYETVGGHTLKRHAGKDHRWLVERLKREPRLKHASSFYDYETAEKVVEAAISQNREKIKRWLSNPHSPNKLILIYRGEKPIGIKVERGERKFVESICKDARVVLKKDDRFGFIVLTAYPI